MKGRILYLCPFAHYSGHHPHVVIAEPRRFEEHGIHVDVLTTCGILEPHDSIHPSVRYMQAMAVLPWLKWFRKYMITRWLVMLLETLLTTLKACTLPYDIVYVRDGEPYLFIPLLLQFLTRKKLVVSLTGSALAPPRIEWNVFRPQRWLYSIAAKLFASGVSLYNPKRSALVTQNEDLQRRGFKCIPYGVESNGIRSVKSIARNALDLPQDKFIVLSFGVTHVGKSVDTIARAIDRIDNAYMLHTGSLRTLGFVDVPRISNMKIIDSYITDAMKPVIFGAADVMVLSYTRDFKSTASMLWEAAKYRMPIICSDSGTLGTLTKRYDAGLVFEAENVDALVVALEKFRATHNEHREGLDQLVRDFSVEKWIEAYRQIFEEVVSADA